MDFSGRGELAERQVQPLLILYSYLLTIRILKSRFNSFTAKVGADALSPNQDSRGVQRRCLHDESRYENLRPATTKME